MTRDALRKLEDPRIARGTLKTARDALKSLKTFYDLQG